jgi:ribose transport system substrate-binding protein
VSFTPPALAAAPIGHINRSRVGLHMKITSKTVAAAGMVSILALTACGSGNKSGASGNAAAAAAVVGKEGTQADLTTIASLCGTKKIKVALADGFGGNSWRKITRAEFEDEAKKCPNITDVLYTDAQNNPQKAISDINGLVAQGVDVIITFADASEALLPAVKKATAAGVKVVPYVAGPGGTPGKDYTDFVAEDVVAYGEQLAQWTVDAMGHKGNLVMLGGIAGNAYSANVFEGVQTVVAKYPGLTLLDKDQPVATDWEPGKTQQVVAGLITKFGTIDGIVSDYGGGSVGGIRAFLAAGKSIPPWSANDSNEFACLWNQYKASNPKYQIATISSRNWISRVALRHGVAAAAGLTDPEPSIIKLSISEDSIKGGALAPKCDKSLPPDAILSSQLSHDQLKALFK